jgi:hypothetical protein
LLRTKFALTERYNNNNLLIKLKEFGVGCYIGTTFLGALVYVDDVVLLAPTSHAVRILLQKCADFAEDFSVIFNARKSKCIYYSGKLETQLFLYLILVPYRPFY